MKRKLKRFFGFFKVSNLKREVAQLGFSISFKNLLVVTCLLLFTAFIAGYLLRLDLAYCAVLALFFFACMPSMIIARFKASYELNRFNDTVNYMEQVIYAFHKSNKIREALVDVHEVARGNVKETVAKMIDCIDYDMTTPKIYHKALKIMQDEYNCSRMEILHNYFIEIEENGGDSGRSLNMLLTDIRAWSQRTLVHQQNRKNIQSKITLSIFLAMLSCGFMVNMIPEEYVVQIVALPAYQLGTLGVLLACIALYVVSANRVGISFLDYETDGETSARALRQMDFIREFGKKDHIKPAIIKFVIFLPFIIICALKGFYLFMAILVVMTIMFVLQDFSKKNTAVKQVVREVNKMFPTWIRNLVLYLQTDNVHVAIKKSYKTCPAILKDEVKDFINNLSDDPSSIRPYNEFLKAFDVSNLKLSVHYLYSISQFGTEDMLAQLDYLIEQNTQLSIAEENIRNEDSLAGFSVMTLLPMLFAVIKLVIDLMLFMNIFMTYMSSYGAF